MLSGILVTISFAVKWSPPMKTTPKFYFKTSESHSLLRPKYITWLIIYDLSDFLVVLRKIRNV